MSTHADDQVRQMRQAARNDPKEDDDRDPDDIEISESSSRKSPSEPLGSFGDSSLCYCCGGEATQVIMLGGHTYASCNHCSLIMEVLWAEIANTATRYRDAADKRGA